MVFDPLSLLALLAGTIFLGYLGHVLSTRTGIPDFLWLLLLGLFLGPGIHFFASDLFITFTPLMSALALATVLFESGVKWDLYELLSVLPKAVVFTICSLLLSMFLIGGFLYFMGFSILEGALLGAIIGGGTSSIVVFSFFGERSESKAGKILLLESVINNPLSIIIVVSLLQIEILRVEAVGSLLRAFVGVLSVGVCFGFLFGLIWLWVLRWISKYANILTWGMLLGLYVLTEVLGGGGGGAIACLIFGLVLGNSQHLSRIFKRQLSSKQVLGEVFKFNTELTFLLRAFFFTLLGLTATLDLSLLFASVCCLILFVLARLLVAHFLGYFLKLTKNEKILIGLMVSSGFSVALTSQLPRIYDPEGQLFTDPGIFANFAVWITLLSILISLGVSMIFRKRGVAPVA